MEAVSLESVGKPAVYEREQNSMPWDQTQEKKKYGW